jgi:hypothetical protein
MNEEKAKILLRLYKQNLITADEFLILCKEEPIYISHTIPNFIPTQPFIYNQPLNSPYYTSGTGHVTVTTNGSNSTNSVTPNGSMNSQSTVGGAFSKKWVNPEES